MNLQLIPLTKLKISPLNMRHARKSPDVSDILPTIRARGLLQPLIVRPKGKAFEVLAGRRRYYALKTLASETGETPQVPCAVMEAGDDASAIEASLIENTARLDPDEVARWETFARLTEQGRSVLDIATTFGVSEIMVRRALALGNLIPEIRKAYRDEDIDAYTVRELTLASPEQQREWMKLFDEPGTNPPLGFQLKQWLFGAEIKTEAALFPLEDYRGSIVSDLFEEHRYFGDAARFWELQNVAIAERRQALLDDGWAEVTVLDIGERFWSWDYVATPKEDGGHVYIEVCQDGTVNIHEGYLSPSAHARLRRASEGRTGEEIIAPVRPELTRAAQNYLQLHRHAAVRHALLSHPQTALRLIAAHMIVGSSLWQVDPEPQKADKLATTASVMECRAETELAKERKTVLALLGEDDTVRTLVANNTDDYRLVRLFLTLDKLPDEDVLRILTCLMAETLEAASGTVEALGSHLGMDMKAYWQPDDAFFNLLRDKKAVNAMLADIGGTDVAAANIAEPVKTQKRIIRDFLAGTGRPKVEDWLPGYLEFPFRAYTRAGGGALQGDSERMQSLLSSSGDQ